MLATADGAPASNTPAGSTPSGPWKAPKCLERSPVTWRPKTWCEAPDGALCSCRITKRRSTRARIMRGRPAAGYGSCQSAGPSAFPRVACMPCRLRFSSRVAHDLTTQHGASKLPRAGRDGSAARPKVLGQPAAAQDGRGVAADRHRAARVKHAAVVQRIAVLLARHGPLQARPAPTVTQRATRRHAVQAQRCKHANRLRRGQAGLSHAHAQAARVRHSGGMVVEGPAAGLPHAHALGRAASGAAREGSRLVGRDMAVVLRRAFQRAGRQLEQPEGDARKARAAHRRRHRFVIYCDRRSLQKGACQRSACWHHAAVRRTAGRSGSWAPTPPLPDATDPWRAPRIGLGTTGDAASAATLSGRA